MKLWVASLLMSVVFAAPHLPVELAAVLAGIMLAAGLIAYWTGK